VSLYELPDEMYSASMPRAVCSACGNAVMRRYHRVYLRATWRPQTEVLCPDCWGVICSWASRFAFTQLELPLGS
jgi:hypothetical protein